MFRSLRPVVLLVLAIAVACTDQPTEPTASGVVAVDSAAVESPMPLFASTPTGGHANNCSVWSCPTLVITPDSDRAYFDAHPWANVQLQPFEIRFLKTTTNLRVRMWGHIPCVGTFGSVEAFGASGASIGTFALRLDAPSDCGEDEVAGTASVLIPGTVSVAKLIAHPPVPMSFPMPEAYRKRYGWPPGSLIYGDAKVSLSFDWQVETKSHIRLFYPPTVPRMSDGTPLILPRGIRLSATAYDSTMGRPPLWNGEFWPDSAFIGVMLDSSGIPLVGRNVSLKVIAIDSGGRSVDSLFGHAHSALAHPKPAGALRHDTLTTVSGGRDSTPYIPSQVSGPVIIMATAAGADTAIDTLWVGVTGLSLVVPEQNIDTTGGTDRHPYGHNVWITGGMLDSIRVFRDSVRAMFNKGIILNDASLPWGGKFDLHEQWDGSDTECMFTRGDGTRAVSLGGCHQTHRTGWDVDLRTTGEFDGPFKDQHFRTLVRMWRSITCSKALNEGDHIHLALREGGALADRTIPACAGEE